MSQFESFSEGLGDLGSSLTLFKPELGILDKQELYKLLNDAFKKHVYGEEYKSRPYSEADEKELSDLLPKHFLYDVFVLFRTPIEELKIDKASKAYKAFADILERQLPNNLFQTITKNNNLFAYIVTEEIVKSFFPLQDKEKQDGKGEGQEGIAEAYGKDSGQGTKAAFDRAMEKIQKFEDDKPLIESTMEDNTDTGDEEEDVEQRGASKELTELSLSQISDLDEIMRLLKTIDLSKSVLNSFIKTSLKLSTTYFSSTFKTVEESIFDADDLEDIQNLELLDPDLPRVCMLDMITHEKKYFMKMDVYFDMSGSMQGFNRKLVLASLLILNKMKIIHTLYPFGSSVYPAISPAKALNIDFNSGTHIDGVIEQVIRLDRPSLILTDCQDRVSLYSDKAYFIGLAGSDFHYFNPKEYKANKQLVYYRDKSFHLYE